MYIKSFDNIKIYYYKRFIRKAKGTIVFVHGGFHGNHTLLKGIMEPFKREYNIIAPDLRGRGNSDFPRNIEEDKLENYIKDLYEILKYEKIKEIYLVGVSFGGMISLGFSIEYRKKIKIKRLVLISSTYNLKEINKRTKIAKLIYTSLANIITILTNPLKERKKENIDYSSAFGKFFDIKYGIKNIMNNSIKTIVLRYKLMKTNMNSSISIDKLNRLNIKMLLIYGDKDFFFKFKSQEEIKDRAQDCIIRKISNAGHNLYIKKAKQATQIIKKFFIES